MKHDNLKPKWTASTSHMELTEPAERIFNAQKKIRTRTFKPNRGISTDIFYIIIVITSIIIITPPKTDMEPEKDGFQVRNLLFQGAPIFKCKMLVFGFSYHYHCHHHYDYDHCPHQWFTCTAFADVSNLRTTREAILFTLSCGDKQLGTWFENEQHEASLATWNGETVPRWTER